MTLALFVLVGLAIGCASGHTSQAQTAQQPMVTADDISHSAGQPIEQILEAKVPGIIVQRVSDGSIAIRIRGVPSFYSGSEPLFVIDGVPVTPGPGGALNGVNPYDIDTIKVLKNPAETAMYGVRGANGVIIITTKRPDTNKGT
jgi:TonB-dependent SusC/RagA subfamily outer membrane receptor